ncbi:hypothetical protein [Nitrososphaera viennensis]|uniref:Uncharacterized protein n=1 Tax=Nitrososphaera viennensis TaxID=1034015 RepID=A0A977IBU3_9ARCH|nr:hypothetical protein [Nitrososphaera viennensis]UVS68099.1 hypothetical protein NWT39_09325 [Nitrososphaera viennensis]
MHAAGVIAIALAGIIAAVNVPAAYSCRAPEQQHMNVLVISDDTGCSAELIKKGMLLPDPEGNKQHFPKDYDVTCLDGLVKKDANTFQYIEKVTVPVLRKAAQEKAGNVEELYIFVYQQPLEKQFRDYIAMRFGTERASMVDGWANVAENTAFSPVWASTIYHEGRHLAIHGTWHDDAGRPLPDNRINYYPGFGPGQDDDDAGAGLLKFLNVRPASLPGCGSSSSSHHNSALNS